MHGGDFSIDKKTYMYILFFMVGFMIAIIVIDSVKIPINYVWIPFLSSVFLSTIAILYTVEDVRLHEVILAAVSSVVLSFTIGVFGAISGALLLFQGISASLGFAATSVGSLGVSLGIASAAAVPAVVVAAATMDPQSAIRAAADTPLPRSRASSLEDIVPSFGDADYQRFGGGKRRRGGMRWRW
jgi:hypothetical protein